MDELDFYNNLKNIILNSNPKDTASLATLEEVRKRLSELEQREEVNKWDKLCNLIEETAERFERENKEYVDITITCDNSEIVITNNLYNNWTVL